MFQLRQKYVIVVAFLRAARTVGRRRARVCVRAGTPAAPAPPVTVKLAIGEAQQFCNQIQETVEVRVEHDEPEEVIRQGKLEHALDEAKPVHAVERGHAVPDNRHNPLLAQDVQCKAEENLVHPPKGAR